MINTNSKPLVTLITPGWNGKQFVHRLLDSIIAQTYRPIQYIYVDDCSTDGTIDVIESYRKKFEEAGIDFTLIRHEKNKGLSETVMTGLQLAKGEFFSNPEYDDILIPTSVQKRIDYMLAHPDCAVVTADAWMVDDNNLNDRSKRLCGKRTNRFDRNHFFQSCLTQSIYNAACFMVRMECFDKVCPTRRFFSSRMAPNQQILLPLYYHWNRGFIDEPLSLFVIRSESVSHSNDNTLLQKMNRLDEYHRILFKTLDSIDMLPEDRDLYKQQIDINFQKDYIQLGFEYNDQKLFTSAYEYLQNEDEIVPEYESKKKIMESPLKYRWYKATYDLNGNVITNIKVFIYRLLH